MRTVPSFTFAGGELAPGLWGRVDLNKYQTGVKLARNFHVGVEGGLIKRPGMYFIGKTKFQIGPIRIVRWRISDDDSYILEFGLDYLRFIRLGGHVMWPDGHVPHADSNAYNSGGFVEINTDLGPGLIPGLKFTFANDVAYIFHKSMWPKKLTRLGLYDWKWELVNFNPHEAAPTGLAGVWQSAESSGWEAVTGSDPVADYTEVQKLYQYKISATMANGLETLASAPITVAADLGNSQLRVLLTWAAKAGAEKYTIYKGENGIFGFIGYVDAGATLEYVDDNIAPSYDVVPIENWGGFGEDLEVDTGAEFPAVGQFYKQRLGYASTLSQPQALWFSRPLFFHAMTRSIPSQEDDAIKVVLVGNERHTIHHMLQLKKFIIFTDSGEWLLNTTGGDALSGATIDPTMETAYGSDPYLEPLPIGNRILFVQNISNIVRDMGYDFANDAYTADELSRLARHLFENTTIVSWAYSKFPHNALWCVKANGTFCCMTYVREHEIWGWSSMATEGYIASVATTPEIDQEASYFVTTRIVNGVATRMIERSEVLFSNNPRDDFYVDCGLTFKDTRTFDDLIRWTDTIVSLSADSHTRNLGDEILVETADFSLRFIVIQVAPGELAAETKYGEIIPTLTVTTGTVFLCESELGGFEHLANETGLVGLVDGSVVEDLSVSAAGVVSLPVKAAVAHIGYPYTARIETLDIDDRRVAGNFLYRAVDSVKIHLKNSRGVFVGASAATERELEEIPSRTSEDLTAPPEPLNGVYEIQPHAEWAMSAGVVVEAPYPLPCHVLNIVPDVSYGED